MLPYFLLCIVFQKKICCHPYMWSFVLNVSLLTLADFTIVTSRFEEFDHAVPWFSFPHRCCFGDLWSLDLQPQLPTLHFRDSDCVYWPAWSCPSSSLMSFAFILAYFVTLAFITSSIFISSFVGPCWISWTRYLSSQLRVSWFLPEFPRFELQPGNLALSLGNHRAYLICFLSFRVIFCLPIPVS